MATEIFVSVQTIFRQVFANEKMTIEETTRPDDIEAWDSLRHAILINAIESHFEIKFNLMEMIGFETVGDICKGIQSQLS
ncbi:MAG: acyl carrier protein [Saprospiraceae bacterium]